ncbi:MAG: hypothetical protein ACLTS6_08570 [Anaerobutyricum sp.]
MVKINGEEKQLDGRNLLFCWWISTWWMSTNLNRQMYFVSQLGKPKAEALPEVAVSDKSISGL